MGLTLRRTARRIKRLNGARMLILSGYAAQPHSQTPDFLTLSPSTVKVSICWLGLHPPAKVSFKRKRILLSVSVEGCDPFPPTVGRYKRTSRVLAGGKGCSRQ